MPQVLMEGTEKMEKTDFLELMDSQEKMLVKIVLLDPSSALTVLKPLQDPLDLLVPRELPVFPVTQVLTLTEEEEDLQVLLAQQDHL